MTAGTHSALPLAPNSSPAAAMLGRVAVLMGGESAEREISLRSGSAVLAALQRHGVNAVAFDPSERPLQDLAAEQFDRAFIALHGRFGEDGTVQGALELLKIPYTGSGVTASAVAIDKAMTKRVWQSMGLPTPGFLSLQRNTVLSQVIAQLGLPLAVKPAREGSSLGFTKVTQAADLKAAVELARQYDPEVIAEQFVEGREFTCALLEDAATGCAAALPVIEIVAPAGNYDYQHKYFGNETRYLCPAPLDPAIEARMKEISLHAYQALGCQGWARVDLLWNGSGEPMLLEINTCPGMTDHSLVPMAAAQVGIAFDQLVMRLLATARLKLARSQ
jgi:D-alanine-D-alanine ligase